MHVHQLVREHMAPVSIMGGKQTSKGIVMLLSWETFGPGIHIDVTVSRTTNLQTKYNSMLTVFHNFSVLLQDNVPWHTAEIVQELFEEQVKDLTWPLKSSTLNLIKNLWGMQDKQFQSLEV